MHFLCASFLVARTQSYSNVCAQARQWDLSFVKICVCNACGINKPQINLAVTFRFDGSSPWWVSELKRVASLTSKVQCWGSGMAGFGLITGSVITPLPVQRSAPKQPAASALCNRMHSSVTARQGNCHLTPTTWQGESERGNAHMQTHTNTHAWPRSRQTDTMRKQKTHLSTYVHTDSPPTKCQSMVRIPSLLDTQSIRASYEDCVIHYSVSCSHEGSMGGMWGLLNIKLVHEWRCDFTTLCFPP